MRSVRIARAAFYNFRDDHDAASIVATGPRGPKPGARRHTSVAKLMKRGAGCMWVFSCLCAVAVAGPGMRGDTPNDTGRLAKSAATASTDTGLSESAPLMGPADWVGDLPPADVGIVASQGIVPAPGCALLGDLITQFNRDLVFRANVFHPVEPVVISEFGFLLDIDPNISVDLFLSIHEKPFPFDPTAFFEADAVFPPGGIVIHVPVDPARTGPELFTTGPLATPVPLNTDTGYVFGVAWGLEFLIYGRDPSQSAAPGTVLPDFPNAVFVGPASRTIPIDQLPLPMPASLLLLPSGTGGPWGMEICVTGACCLPNGTCADLTGTECQVAGGIETMPGMTCAQLESDNLGCPLVVGACCTNQSCAIENKFECEGGGGTWFRDIADCSDPVLCEPKGACCTTAGTCLDAQTRPACEGIGGNYRGDDSDCATVNPQCNRGACCLGPGNCDLRAPGVEVFECDAARGEVFHGFGIACDPNPCFVTGACCTGTTCAEMTSEDCLAVAGHYRGDDSLCASLAVPCGSGACCRADVGCSDAAGIGLPEPDCTALGGTFRGDGTNCDAITPVCPGMCCEGSVCSDNVNPVFCSDLLGGAFGGYMACDDFIPGTDPPPCDVLGPTGPCCLPNGNCTRTTDAVCLQLDGTVSAAQDCASAVCAPASPQGGCCFPDETCAMQTEAECVAAGGFYRGDGVGCPAPGETDCLRGACCLIVGGCLPNVAQADCDASVGSFQVGVACAGAACADGGACCLPNATCATLASDLCVAARGLFQGVGVACADVTTCVRGACCDAGTCTETLQADCAGTYLGDNVACVPNACDTGACCRDGQPCAITTVAVCATDGGVHSGAATTCDGAPCLQGACCHGDGTCEDAQFNSMCMAPLDHLSAGLTCAQVNCQPRGACCLNGTCGDDIDVAQCDALGGMAGPPGSQCSDFPDACAAGACCLDDGACLDEASPGVPMIRMACETLDMPGGTFTPDATCLSLTCPQPGACCLPAGGCDVVIETQCAAMGGAFVGEGAACEATTCASGACCGVDAVCVDNQGYECDQIEGLFSVGFACNDGIVCSDRGACCHPDATCTTETATDCFFFGGTYAGNATTCAATSCAIGSCCELDGTCVDGAIEFQCGAADGFSSGATCANVVCATRGGCCVATTCSLATQTDCLAGGGSYLGDGIDCAGDPCGTLTIVSSVPASGEIDARQPTSIDCLTGFGWDSIELTFDNDAAAVNAADFSVTSTSGAPPTVSSVAIAGTTVTVSLSGSIPAGAWTQVTHTPSGSSVCLGYLPADANADGTSSPSDILAVIDSLNGVAPRPVYATDTDRSGVAGPEDILRVIDLLNGAACFDAWLDQTLGVSPCP
ncbi:MAG: hypothetical protein ACE5E5_05255 [Phycisphaerae bacterium]